MGKISVTFKKRPKETGLAAVGSPHQSVDIKVGGKECGYIEAPSWRSVDRKWCIRFQVMLPAEKVVNCKWDWVELPVKFDTELQAREYLKTNIADIVERIPPLYFREDD